MLKTITGIPAGRNLFSEARGMMKQSRSKVANEIGSICAGILSETTKGA